jgi:hypothetical protein
VGRLSSASIPWPRGVARLAGPDPLLLFGSGIISSPLGSPLRSLVISVVQILRVPSNCFSVCPVRLPHSVSSEQGAPGERAMVDLEGESVACQDASVAGSGGPVARKGSEDLPVFGCVDISKLQPRRVFSSAPYGG